LGFDGDGKLDLITTHASKNNVSVLLGKGDGTFQAPSKTMWPTLPAPPWQCEILTATVNR
jgi:hypothetical protein